MLTLELNNCLASTNTLTTCQTVVAGQKHMPFGRENMKHCPILSVVGFPTVMFPQKESCMLPVF